MYLEVPCRYYQLIIPFLHYILYKACQLFLFEPPTPMSNSLPYCKPAALKLTPPSPYPHWWLDAAGHKHTLKIIHQLVRRWTVSPHEKQDYHLHC